MTLWNKMGRPSWNAFTNTYTYNAYSWTNPFTGTTYTAPGGTGVVNPTTSNNGNQYFTASGNALWLTGYQSTRVRPVMFIDKGQVQWAGTQFYTVNGVTPAVRHELLQFGTFSDYNLPPEYFASPEGVLPYNAIKASTDKSFYDYESLSLSGLNYGKKSADLWRVELEQFIINTPMHVLAFQLGLFKERIEDYRRTFVGNGGDGVPLYIQPDVNTTLPDGTPNPYYGAPFISALAPQTYVNPIDTMTHRANVVYQLDLTREKSLLRHLGKMKILGYAETFGKTQVPSNLRYQDQISAVYSPWLTNSIRNNNNAKFLARYYLGDANGGNVDYGSSAPPINNIISFRRYGSMAGETLGWYTINGVPISPQYFSQAQQKTETTTRGFILQNYLVKDRVITTWGRRKDTLRTRNSLGEPASALDPITGLTTSFSWMDNYGDWNITNRQTNSRMSQGYTDNKGIVVKPTKWLSLRYNQSTSFKPEDFGIDFQGNPLENSRGESKDYGVSLNLFKGEIYINLTRFETDASNSRTPAIDTVARRITNLDYDIDPNSNGSQFDLEDWLITRIMNRDGINANAEAAALEAHRLMGLTEERIALNRLYGNNRSTTTTRHAEGYELAIDYNPTSYLSFKLNASKQETIYSDIAPTWQDYRDERMVIWKSITSPDPTYTYDSYVFSTTGVHNGDMRPIAWWSDPNAGTNTAAQNWVSLNDAPMKVNLALQGKVVPQNAKYKCNLLGRLQLGGIFKNTPFIKDITVGGKVSWIDKSALGFYAGTPEADGRVREYDANRPIWTRAKIYADAFATYDFRFYKNRVKGNVQLNAKNVGESGRLQAFGVNPDGSKFNYRIIDPTEYILSVNFEL